MATECSFSFSASSSSSSSASSSSLAVDTDMLKPIDLFHVNETTQASVASGSTSSASSQMTDVVVDSNALTQHLSQFEEPTSETQAQDITVATQEDTNKKPEESKEAKPKDATEEDKKSKKRKSTASSTTTDEEEKAVKKSKDTQDPSATSKETQDKTDDVKVPMDEATRLNLAMTMDPQAPQLSLTQMTNLTRALTMITYGDAAYSLDESADKFQTVGLDVYYPRFQDPKTSNQLTSIRQTILKAAAYVKYLFMLIFDHNTASQLVKDLLQCLVIGCNPRLLVTVGALDFFAGCEKKMEYCVIDSHCDTLWRQWWMRYINEIAPECVKGRRVDMIPYVTHLCTIAYGVAYVNHFRQETIDMVKVSKKSYEMAMKDSLLQFSLEGNRVINAYKLTGLTNASVAVSELDKMAKKVQKNLNLKCIRDIKKVESIMNMIRATDNSQESDAAKELRMRVVNDGFGIAKEQIEQRRGSKPTKSKKAEASDEEEEYNEDDKEGEQDDEETETDEE